LRYLTTLLQNLTKYTCISARRTCEYIIFITKNLKIYRTDLKYYDSLDNILLPKMESSQYEHDKCTYHLKGKVLHIALEYNSYDQCLFLRITII
jgi:hypothetical protein